MNNLTKLLMLSLSFGVTSILSAEQLTPSATISVTPQQCVAMRQGQTCYVDVTIKWTASAIGDYCLHSSLQTKPHQCWQQEHSALFERELAASQDIIFSLQAPQSKAILAKAVLEMAWVYDKNSRKNVSWRMF